MTYIPEQGRIEYLDYAKAIAIFMVLMCHRCLLKIHILGYAMPVFFILSGYTSKDQTDLRRYAGKLVKSFLVPYWISIVAAAIGIFLGTKGYMNGNWNRSYYGPGGVIGLFLSFLAGLLLVYAGIMLCRAIWLSPLKPLKTVLDVLGRNTMPVYLWHLALYFAADLIAVFVFRWQMTPEPFWVEIFDGGHLMYRWVVLFITWALLAGFGEKTRRR